MSFVGLILKWCSPPQATYSMLFSKDVAAHELSAFFALVELFCMSSASSEYRMYMYFSQLFNRDPNLLLPFRYVVLPAISWPSLWSCRYTVWMTSDLPREAVGAILLVLFFLAVCSACYMSTRRLVSFFLDLIHSGLSCSSSETLHLCINISLLVRV